MQEHTEIITSLILNGELEITEDSGLYITYNFAGYEDDEYYLEVKAENEASDHLPNDDMFVYEVRLIDNTGDAVLFAEFHRQSWNRVTTQQVVDITEQLNHLRLSSEQKRLYALTNKN